MLSRPLFFVAIQREILLFFKKTYDARQLFFKGI